MYVTFSIKQLTFFFLVGNPVDVKFMGKCRRSDYKVRICGQKKYHYSRENITFFGQDFPDNCCIR